MHKLKICSLFFLLILKTTKSTSAIFGAYVDQVDKMDEILERRSMDIEV